MLFRNVGGIFDTVIDAHSYFFENIGTAPQVGGMIQYAQLPQEEVKIIGWHRSSPSDKLDLTLNTTHIVPVARYEGNYWHNAQDFLDKTIKILEKYPHNPLIIYTGIYQNGFVAELIRRTKNRLIMHIHFYEDGFFNVVASKSGQMKQKRLKLEDVSRLCDYVFGITNKRPSDYPFSALYPVTYHVAGATRLNSDDFSGLKEFLGNIEDFDIYEIGDKLTSKQKEQLCLISNLDCSLIQKLNKQSVMMFSTGHVHQNITNPWKQTPENMVKIYKKAIAGQYGSIPENAIWVYKLHPSLGITDLAPYIKKEIPSAVEIPATVPFEILVIEGLNIHKIIGSGSSLFYWIKPEQVLKYISHPLYDYTLLSFNVIQKDNIIYPHIEVNDESEKNKIILKYKNREKHFYPSYQENYYCRKNALYQCGLITWKQDGPCIEMQWNSKRTEIFCREEAKIIQQKQNMPAEKIYIEKGFLDEIQKKKIENKGANQPVSVG